MVALLGDALGGRASWGTRGTTYWQDVPGGKTPRGSFRQAKMPGAQETAEGRDRQRLSVASSLMPQIVLRCLPSLPWPSVGTTPGNVESWGSKLLCGFDSGAVREL